MSIETILKDHTKALNNVADAINAFSSKFSNVELSVEKQAEAPKKATSKKSTAKKPAAKPEPKPEAVEEKEVEDTPEPEAQVKGPTEEEARKAISEVAKKDRSAAVAILNELGANMFPKVDPADYSKLIELCEAA